MGPAVVAETGGHEEVHLSEGAMAFGAEIKGVHVGVEEGGAFVEGGVDGRAKLKGFTPLAVGVEE